MSDNANPLGHLGDALVVFGLIIALMLGLDVKLVVLIWLCLEFLSHICRAINTILVPLIEFARR